MTELKQLNNLISSEDFDERYSFGVLVLKDKVYVRVEDDELIISDCKNGANQENSPEVKSIAIEDYIALNKMRLKNDKEILNLIYQHYKKIGNREQEIKYLRKIANLGDNEAKNELKRIGLEILRLGANTKGVKLLEKIEDTVKNAEISLGLYSIFANNDNEKATKYLEMTIEIGDINLLSKLAKIDDHTNNYFNDKLPSDMNRAIACYKTILDNSKINITNYKNILDSNNENKKFFVEILTKLCFFCYLKKIDKNYYSDYELLFGKVFSNKNYKEISKNVISSLKQRINEEEQKIRIKKEDEITKAKREKIEKLNSEIASIREEMGELNRKRSELRSKIIKAKELKYKKEEKLEKLKIKQEDDVKEIDKMIISLNSKRDLQIINMIKSCTVKGNKLYGSREIIRDIKSIVIRNDRDRLNDLKNKLLSGDLLFIKYTNNKYCIVGRSDFEIFQKAVVFPADSINYEYSNSEIYCIENNIDGFEFEKINTISLYPNGVERSSTRLMVLFSKENILKAKSGNFELMAKLSRVYIEDEIKRNPNAERIRLCDEDDDAMRNGIIILNDEFRNLVKEFNEDIVVEEIKKISLNEGFLKEIEKVKECIASLDLKMLIKEYEGTINSIKKFDEQEKMKNYELIKISGSAC